MFRRLVGLLALLLVFTVGCGGDARPLGGVEGGVLTFDAAMLDRLDAAPVAPSDAGLPLGAEGDACTWSDGCALGLECVAGLCTAVGGLDQPCRSDDSCDPGLACDFEACRATIQGRFCHCIYETATLSPVRLEMQVGTVVMGPTLTDTCSPCVAIPIGTGIPYVIRQEGATTSALDTGALNLTTEIPELGFAFSVGGIIPGPIACDRAPTGFCSL